ncbi:MAG TPA: hypothetical protein VGK00_03065 [Anaerolineales bacterium]|jgi:hypothetical protein
MKIRRMCGVILVIACLLAASGSTSAAAQRGQTWQYFPETGHTVSGDFWTYYKGIPNAALIFGSPITEQYNENSTGRLVQYFQRARFEYYPERPAGQRVALSNLGAYVYQHSPSNGEMKSANPIGCRFFPETGFSLCYAFLEFFDHNGGEAVFGRPLSDFVFYHDRIVQYFERARFDYFPEYPEGQKVSLAQLGRITFDLTHEDANRLQPLRADNAPSDVMEIQAHAFTLKALTRLEDEQVIYVVVQDQTLKPVAGATTVITINWPQGGQQSVARLTNSSGAVILPIQVQGQPHGSLVLVDTEVMFAGLSAHSRTSFRIWQ